MIATSSVRRAVDVKAFTCCYVSATPSIRGDIALWSCESGCCAATPVDYLEAHTAADTNANTKHKRSNGTADSTTRRLSQSISSYRQGYADIDTHKQSGSCPESAICAADAMGMESGRGAAVGRNGEEPGRVARR
jgi:hypothetical protein